MKKALQRIPSRIAQSSPEEFIEKWTGQKAIFKDLLGTGFLPDYIKSPEQAMAIVLTGKELGVTPMVALRKIQIIKGTTTVAPELMLGLVRQSGQLKKFIVERNAKWCKITVQRKGEDVFSDTFTFEEASLMKTRENNETISLTQKFNWRTMPSAMLYARCLSRIMRTIFPDIVHGLYLTEEIEDTLIEEPIDADAPEDVPSRQVEIAPGITVNTFDPSKERTDGHGKYPNTLWIDLPSDYLEHLKNKGTSPDFRVKADASLRAQAERSRLETTVPEHDDGKGLEFDKIEPKPEAAPFVPSQALTELIADLKDSGVTKSAELTQWSRTNKEKMNALPADQKEHFYVAFNEFSASLKKKG